MAPENLAHRKPGENNDKLKRWNNKSEKSYRIAKWEDISMKVEEHSFEYFKGQNTGWSGGVSWFDNNSKQYKTYREAMADVENHIRLFDDNTGMKYRVLKVETSYTSFEL